MCSGGSKLKIRRQPRRVLGEPSSGQRSLVSHPVLVWQTEGAREHSEAPNC